MNMKNIRAGLLILSAFCVPSFPLGATTLTMDELPFQPVNGLFFNGVTFHFSIGGNPSLDANYNTGSGGNEQYVQDPALEGNSSGTLTLDFASQTTGLQFGVARSFSGAMTPGLQVSLFDGSLNSLGTFNLNTSVFFTFSEGHFNSSLTIGRAILTFPHAADAPRFAIDKLPFTPVPEPSMVSLLGIGFTIFAAMRLTNSRSRRAAQSPTY